MRSVLNSLGNQISAGPLADSPSCGWLERRTETESGPLEILSLLDSYFMSAKSNNNHKEWGSCIILLFLLHSSSHLYLCYFTKVSIHQKLEILNETNKTNCLVLPHRSFENHFSELLHCTGSLIDGASRALVWVSSHLGSHFRQVPFP